MPQCFPPCPSSFHPQTREYHVTFWSSFHYTNIATLMPSNYCINTLKLFPKSKRYIETNQFKIKLSPSYKKLSICVPELKNKCLSAFHPAPVLSTLRHESTMSRSGPPSTTPTSLPQRHPTIVCTH